MSARRGGLLVPAVTAAGVLGVLLLQDVVLTVLNLVNSASFTGQGVTYFGAIIGASWIGSLTGSLPFAAGAFVALWQIAPIDRDLRLGHVIARSVFAAGLGSVAVLVVGTAVEIVRLLPARIDFAFVAGLGGGPFGAVVAAVFTSLQAAASTFVTAVPLVVLAGVLAWVWSERADRSSLVDGMPDP